MQNAWPLAVASLSPDAVPEGTRFSLVCWRVAAMIFVSLRNSLLCLPHRPVGRVDTRAMRVTLADRKDECNERERV